MEPGLTACEREGLNGNCGPECPVFLVGDCENVDEVNQEFQKKLEEE